MRSEPGNGQHQANSLFGGDGSNDLATASRAYVGSRSEATARSTVARPHIPATCRFGTQPATSRLIKAQSSIEITHPLCPGGLVFERRRYPPTIRGRLGLPSLLLSPVSPVASGFTPFSPRVEGSSTTVRTHPRSKREPRNPPLPYLGRSRDPGSFSKEGTLVDLRVRGGREVRMTDGGYELASHGQVTWGLTA